MRTSEESVMVMALSDNMLSDFLAARHAIGLPYQHDRFLVPSFSVKFVQIQKCYSWLGMTHGGGDPALMHLRSKHADDFSEKNRVSVHASPDYRVARELRF